MLCNTKCAALAKLFCLWNPLLFLTFSLPSWSLMPKAPYLPIFTGTGDQTICQVVEKLKRKMSHYRPKKWPRSITSGGRLLEVPTLPGALNVIAYHLQKLSCNSGWKVNGTPLFGLFLLFYYMYFTNHLPSIGSPGLLPPTPPFLCHSSDRSCCSTTCISLTISPVWAPWVFCHPPPFLCNSSDRSCCSTTCISLTISPVWASRVVCHPPLPFCVTLRIVPFVLLHVFH